MQGVERPLVKVKLHTLLVKKTGVREYSSSAATVNEILDELRDKYGDSIDRYLEGCIVMIDGKRADSARSMKKKIKSGAEISVFPRVAGG